MGQKINSFFNLYTLSLTTKTIYSKKVKHPNKASDIALLKNKGILKIIINEFGDTELFIQSIVIRINVMIN